MSPTRRPSNAPVYRDVLSRAVHTAWHERRFWPLAFCAALLASGGTYDVIWKATETIKNQGLILTNGSTRLGELGTSFARALGGSAPLLGIANGLEVVMTVAIILVAFAAFSCICQGALVYAVGAIHRGTPTTFKEALGVGAGAFWPIAALNALVLATLWILRFLVALALHLALGNTTIGNWFLYLASYVVFIAIVFVIYMVHIFALNAMILQGAPVADAIVRGYMTFKKHWVTAIETTALLFLAAIGIWAIFVCLYFILMIPLFAAVIAASVLQSQAMLQAIMGIGLAAFIFSLFAATAFTTLLQYSTWTYLYRRLGEGGVLPKLHRFVRMLSGSYSVPSR